MSNVAVPLLLLTITVALVKLCSSAAIGSTLTPNQSLADGDVLISDGQTFTLGFFRPGNSTQHYLGVWYTNVSEQTVVWVANRNSPLNDSSGLVSFNAAGNLILTARNSGTKNNTPLWSTNVSAASHDGGNSVAGSLSARLLNTGNLEIIQLPSRRVVWQGFDYLTDTVLPFMKLGLDRKTGLNRFITSWKAHDDPGTGSYTYRIDPTGTPQLCLFKGPAQMSWRAGPWNGVRWSGIRKMSTRYIFRGSYADNRDELSLTYGIYDPSVLTRIVVDESGSVNRLTWDEGARRWIRFWYAPEDTCDPYGQCGAYGVCDPNRETGEFECTCLPGYTPRSPRGWYLRDGSGGCVRERSISMCGNGEGFTRIARAKVPDTRVARVNMGASGEACQQECLRNCSCMAYTSANVSGSGSGCLAWYGDLVDLKVYPNPSDGQDLFVRIDAVDLASERKRSKGFRGAKRTWVMSLSPVILVGLLLGVARYCWCIWHSRFAELCSSNNVAYSEYEEESEGGRGKRKINMPFFRLSEIKSATNNFSIKLGEGGFGPVYKGQFGADGPEIAVKRLSKFSGQGAEEFKNEILLIARLQHRNLVRILGCCIQDEEKMLIYEYMTNKSLDSFIFDSSRNAMLDWKKRYEIIIGIARGVLYLHQDSRLKIVHRDLKASNILLDCEMNPKISDFGMARIFGGNQSQANTKRVVGTLGYMSPEYALNGIFSTKSDVFSFGVLILEIIYGKKNFASYNNDPFSTLIKYVWELWQDNQALSIIDPAVGDSWEECIVLRCIHVGLLCVQESPVDRPNMSNVVLMLSSDKTSLPPPKQPALAVRKSSESRVGSTSCPSHTNYVTITLPR